MQAFKPLSGHQIYAQRREPRTSFTVVSLFTASYRDNADRLKASLDRIGLNYAIYRVPSIHRSISLKGSDDIAFSKPNFIHAMLEEYGPAVLYLDADIVVREPPSKIAELAGGDADFAVYNWLADPENAAFLPVEVPFEGYGKNRFYQFSHAVDYFDPSQMCNSGAVQFYRKGGEASAFLAAWQNALVQYPEVVDDQVLDYVFNFLGPRKLKPVWLDKAYCRYAWWIHIRPIIDHPDFPFAGDRSFPAATGKSNFDRARAKQQPAQSPFPRNCLIDVREKQILRVPPPNRWVATPVDQAFWLNE